MSRYSVDRLVVMNFNLAAIHLHENTLDSGVGTMMADQQQFLQSTSIDYSGSSSADETNSCAMENTMWDEWTQQHSVGPGPGDEVSTSNVVLLGLPDLTASTSSASSSRLYSSSFPAQADTLSSWMATFHPQLGLAPEDQAGLDPAMLMHDEAADSLHSETTTGSEYNYRRLVTSSAHPPTTSQEAPSPLFSGIYDDHGAKQASAAGDVAAAAAAAVHVRGPQSPSSPLAIQNGMLNPLGDPWDQHQDQHHHGWSNTRTTTWPGQSRNNIYIPSPHIEEEPDHGRPRHTDIYIGTNGTIESTPGGWTPQFYDGMVTPVTGRGLNTMMMMASTTARDQSEPSNSANLHQLRNRSSAVQSNFFTDHCRPCPNQNVRADDHVWFGKHRLELSDDGDDRHSALQLKRSKNSVGHHASAGPSKWGGHQVQGMLRTSRYYNCPASGSLQESQATDIIAIGPALNTNGKPRARRGSATDPQSVYARQRRERINDRLRTLQHLVPNGAKVDIVTMLDEAYDYVKFLQYQVTLLKSDELWMHATPFNYNGMDIFNLPAPARMQELESSAA